MSDAVFNAADVGLSLARALEAAQLPYALAYGVWALPRATKEVEDDERVSKWDELCATFWREAP